MQNLSTLNMQFLDGCMVQSVLRKLQALVRSLETPSRLEPSIFFDANEIELVGILHRSALSLNEPYVSQWQQLTAQFHMYKCLALDQLAKFFRCRTEVIDALNGDKAAAFSASIDKMLEHLQAVQKAAGNDENLFSHALRAEFHGSVGSSDSPSFLLQRDHHRMSEMTLRKADAILETILDMRPEFVPHVVLLAHQGRHE